MCLVSTTKRDRHVFLERMFRGREPYSKDDVSRLFVINPLGRLIIMNCDNFTTSLQPMVLDNGELVYAITSYGSDEIVMVRDDDDLPLLDTSEMSAKESEEMNNLPPGLLKAAQLETSIHLKNVEKFHIKEESKKYYPKNPATVYHRARRKERLAKNSFGCFCLRILNFFNY